MLLIPDLDTIKKTHSGSLRNQVVGHLRVAEPVDGVPAKDDASAKSTLEFIDKDVVPSDFGGQIRANRGDLGRLAGVHALCLETEPDQATGFQKDRATGWCLHVALATEEDDNHAGNEHAGWEQVGRPETDPVLHFRGGNRRQRTDVDTPVEHVKDLLIRSLGRHDDALAILECAHEGLLALILFSDERRHVGLDATSAETNDNDSDDEARECSATGDRGWDGRQRKNQ